MQCKLTSRLLITTRYHATTDTYIPGKTGCDTASRGGRRMTLNGQRPVALEFRITEYLG